MYSSKIIEATDPDLFVASVRPIGIDFTVTDRGPFWARSTLFNLGRFFAHRTSEKRARVKHVELVRGGVFFLAEPGPSMFINGAEIAMDQIAVVNPGESYISRLSGATQWAAMTLAKEDMDALCKPDADFCTRRLSGAAVLTPLPAALARLRSLHGYLGRLAEDTLELLTNRELAQDLEYSLMAAMRETLRTQASGPHTVARHHCQIVVNRFRAILEAQADQPLQMLEISKKIGVSGRTLRSACHQQLGVSPSHYVMLRRMRSARRALQKADPDVTRVTDIATEHGFWELGRFAVNYRQVFGESPSATLRA
jgi:AraC-like DNA-binding protein